MSNQTLLQVPTEVSDPETLKRFLDRLVERLDIILGYRGDTQYATEEQLTTLQQSVLEQSAETVQVVENAQFQIDQQIQILLGELSTQLEHIQELVGRVDQLETDVSDINLELITVNLRLLELEESLAYSTTALRDFNDSGWTTGPIYTKFTALGSELINSPILLGVDDLTLDDTYGIVTDIVETALVINPAETYKVFVEVRPAYLQRVTMYGPSFYADKVRVGSTWSELITNDWI